MQSSFAACGGLEPVLEQRHDAVEQADMRRAPVPAHYAAAVAQGGLALQKLASFGCCGNVVATREVSNERCHREQNFVCLL
jgi:hypothetical protein